MAKAVAAENSGADFWGVLATVAVVLLIGYLFWLYLKSDSGIPWIG